MKVFNLLVSTIRRREDECCSELWAFLREFGDENAEIRPAGPPGLVIVKTSLDPFLVVERFRKVLNERPWELRYILKIVPIDVCVEADQDRIREAVSKLISKIDKDEAFRITVNKRISDVDTMSLIRYVAEAVDRKVDLKNPDKIVQIEIIGNTAGISVLKPSDILSVQKAREEAKV
jgi:tRNA acetyltransferase TAN1